MLSLVQRRAGESAVVSLIRDGFKPGLNANLDSALKYHARSEAALFVRESVVASVDHCNYFCA